MITANRKSEDNCIISFNFIHEVCPSPSNADALEVQWHVANNLFWKIEQFSDISLHPCFHACATHKMCNTYLGTVFYGFKKREKMAFFSLLLSFHSSVSLTDLPLHFQSPKCKGRLPRKSILDENYIACFDFNYTKSCSPQGEKLNSKGVSISILSISRMILNDFMTSNFSKQPLIWGA